MELRLEGQLDSESALPWIVHRAQLLDLRGWVTRKDTGAIWIVLVGPGPLIDAMEVACSLGPCDIDVERISRREIALDTSPHGFLVA